MKHKESKVIKKTACPKCRARGADRSGNNLAVYDDGHTYCYSCNEYKAGNGSTTNVTTLKPTRKLEMTGVYGPLKDRKISENITKKYGVTIEYDTTGKVTKHHYPYHDSEGKPVASKVRVVAGKQFYGTGDLASGKLFGQHLFREGGKYVTVTEGEVDALAVAEMFDGRWPVVSIKSGAGSAQKDIKENLEWLESFENVVICFDQDDPGQKAVESIQDLFSHDKVRIVTLPMKDAGAMLQEGRVQEFTKAWWDAKPYRPVDVVSFEDTECWDAFVKRGTEEIIPFPKAYGELNTMLNGGVAAGEVTIIGALTSVGKTTMVYNLLYGMITESNKKIGAVFLESDLGETTEKMVSLHSGENISIIPTDVRDNSLYREYYDDFVGQHKGNFHILKHLGVSDVDELFAKMRWMVRGLDCEVLILDPLHAAVRSSENDTIDVFMDRCLKLAKETGVSIIIVSHMRKPAVKDPHDVSEYDMKGSGSINQIAFNTILLSRDKMAEDEYTANSTKVQLVKCRRTGRTGVAGWLYYDETSGKQVAGTPPVEKASEDEEF